MGLVSNEGERLLGEGGGYWRKQLLCPSRLIAWSHRSRFAFGLRRLRPYAGQRFLDYGCGDATFLALAREFFAEAVGVDVDPPQLAACAARLSHLKGLSFMLTEDLAQPRYSAYFPVIACMEVLEHCTEEKAAAVLSDLRRLLAPGGRLLISVPIENGPSLLGKEMARTIAGWRKLGDYQYKETYRIGELLRMMFAGEKTGIERPVYRSDFAPDRPNIFHGHKGFNWRALRRRVEEQFLVEETRFSPLGFLGGFLSSQAWFLCRHRS